MLLPERRVVFNLKVYDRWKMMRVYIIALMIIAVLVSCAAVFFLQHADDVFYIAYIVNSVSVTVSSVIFGIKNGFKWWYAASTLFIETAVMTAFFVGSENDFLPFMFVSYLSVCFVSNAIGAIIGKIKKNNEEEE